MQIETILLLCGVIGAAILLVNSATFLWRTTNLYISGDQAGASVRIGFFSILIGLAVTYVWATDMTANGVQKAILVLCAIVFVFTFARHGLYRFPLWAYEYTRELLRKGKITEGFLWKAGFVCFLAAPFLTRQPYAGFALILTIYGVINIDLFIKQHIDNGTAAKVLWAISGLFFYIALMLWASSELQYNKDNASFFANFIFWSGVISLFYIPYLVLKKDFAINEKSTVGSAMSPVNKITDTCIHDSFEKNRTFRGSNYKTYSAFMADTDLDQTSDTDGDEAEYEEKLNSIFNPPSIYEEHGPLVARYCDPSSPFYHSH